MLDFESFVLKQRTLVVPDQVLKSRQKNVLALCTDVVLSSELPTKVSLEDRVCAKLAADCGEGRDFAVLASGGADSAYLLILLARAFPGSKITAYFAQTASNSAERQSVEILCAKYNIELCVLRSSELDLQSELQRFIANTGRVSRDIAQPLHNAIVSRIFASNPDSTVVDGQYADTLMFANPQNTYFDRLIALRRVPVIGAAINRISSTVPTVLQTGVTRPIDLLKGLFSDLAEVILWLCRVESTSISRKLVEKGLRQFPATVVMQSIFFEVLLEYREADKYILYPQVISPFNDRMLMVDSWKRRKHYNGIFKRKKPVYDFIRAQCPEVLKYVRGRSFEPM